MNRLQRNTKLIDPPLQFKLIVVFIFLAFIAALFQVALLNRSVLALSEHMPTDGDKLLAALPGLITRNILVTLGVLTPAMLLVGAFITHRLAGPIYRFERHLDAIARGEDPGRCRIREGDDLHPLCERINDAFGVLRERHSRQPAAPPAAQGERAA